MKRKYSHRTVIGKYAGTLVCNPQRYRALKDKWDTVNPESSGAAKQAVYPDLLRAFKVEGDVKTFAQAEALLQKLFERSVRLIDLYTYGWQVGMNVRFLPPATESAGTIIEITPGLKIKIQPDWRPAFEVSPGHNQMVINHSKPTRT